MINLGWFFSSRVNPGVMVVVTVEEGAGSSEVEDT